MSEIVSEILSGKVDSQISEIIEAVRFRRDVIEKNKLAEFTVGDQVVFNSRANPRYLKGIKGEIRQTLKKKVSVRVSDPRAKRFVGVITVPVGMIDRIDDTAPPLESIE